VVRRLPGVVDVHDDRDTMVIHASRPEDVLRELLNRDLDISGVEVAGAGLEDAFLALTQEKAN
jgi:ABC-2 type transport system ATP-binding protein